MYIRIQTNISKNGMPYLISALEIDESTSYQQRCFEVPPFYVVGALVNGAQLLIPVFRSFKQIFPNKGESAGILISRDYVLLE